MDVGLQELKASQAELAAAAAAAAAATAAAAEPADPARPPAPTAAAAEQLPSYASAPLIRFEHMRQALALAFRSPVLDILTAMPLHQQLLLITLVRRRSRRSALPSLGEAELWLRALPA